MRDVIFPGPRSAGMSSSVMVFPFAVGFLEDAEPKSRTEKPRVSPKRGTGNTDSRSGQPVDARRVRLGMRMIVRGNRERRRMKAQTRACTEGKAVHYGSFSRSGGAHTGQIGGMESLPDRPDGEDVEIETRAVTGAQGRDAQVLSGDLRDGLVGRHDRSPIWKSCTMPSCSHSIQRQ